MHQAAKAGVECIALDTAHPISDDEPLSHLVVVGGDGSILRYANFASNRDIPILGVNRGRIGFLSEILPEAFPEALLRLQNGEYRLESRMMLSFSAGNGDIADCLNDILVFKQSFSGTVQIEVAIDGQSVGTLFADGVIAATPTGATAYSLSAGGPVIAPGLDAIVITPVCSHTLHMRPIVASPNSEIRFTVADCGCVAADGVKTSELNSGSGILVRRSAKRTTFVRFDAENLFERIHQKLS